MPRILAATILVAAPMLITGIVGLWIPALLKKSKNAKVSKLAKNFLAYADLAVLVFWVGFIMTISQIVFSLIFTLILDPSQLQMPLTNALYQAAVYAAAMVVIIKLSAKIKKEAKTTREELGLTGLPTWTDIGLAPVSFIAYIIVGGAIMAIAEALLSRFSWFDANQAQDVGFKLLNSPFDRIIAFIALVVVAPICEEIVFRGWLYGKLRRKMSMGAAILVVSVFFGIMHGQWNVGINVFALSILLCLEREVTGTIYASILTHMIKNGIAYALLYIFMY
jgi:membrane protease YdiL (CAAX protease family)